MSRAPKLCTGCGGPIPYPEWPFLLCRACQPPDDGIAFRTLGNVIDGPHRLTVSGPMLARALGAPAMPLPVLPGPEGE